MALEIRKAAVLGAGVMGSGIAAHLAGAGIEVFLLDIVPRDLTEDEKKRGLTRESPLFRNRLSLAGVEVARAARPAAFFDVEDAALIRCGNFEDNSDWIGQADWICEVVVESLPIKKKVFENVARHRRPGSIVTSNTSGLYVKDMVEGMSAEMRRCFFVTHFFNPVRYMHLLELVAGADTDPALMGAFADWSERRLGKGIVTGKDTPNFVANRIGVYSIMSLMKHLEKYDMGIETVDSIFGPPCGRPRSAVFRTLDMVGMDTFVHVADNVYDGAPDDEERPIFKAPKVFHDMVGKGWLGDKSNRTGFYKVSKEGGKKEILKLDLKTMTHVPQAKARFKSIGKVRDIEDLGKRLKSLVAQDDDAAKFVWDVFSDSICYAARRIPDIADDIVQIDNGMKWGFAWEMGPFETWDALGVADVAKRLEAEKRAVPPLVRDVLEKGEGAFYVWKNGVKHFWDALGKAYKPVPLSTNILMLRSCKERGMVLEKTGSASLLDIGDGVLLLEFHSKMNAIDADVNATAEKAFERLAGDWKGLVVSNEDAQAFSAGANLMLVMMSIGQKDWKGLEGLVKGFQNMNMRMRLSPKPVVVAPHTLTLGGGCEVTMHAAAVQANAELYIGLVEMGVGLIPAGGGSKEMLFRMKEYCDREGPRGFMPFVQRAFEFIALGKVCTSAKEAFSLGYLSAATDAISMNREHLIADAKKKVLALAPGYIPPALRTISLPGEGGRTALEYGVEQMRRRGLVTEYETRMAARLAWVLTGGNTCPTETVTEQQVLDLECEAFMSLAGEEKTAERIGSMLSSGKVLHN